ncbi:clan AA aspartic protease [Candidatus Saccharibacteria bacterium]|nr:MAG: clan AA aspartic protease [Candidatus Saccharibacteria bacterium]
MTKNDLPVIGRSARVDFGEYAVGVPAKIDTGADNSSVWASNVHIDEEGVLVFSLFGKGSPYYNGNIIKCTDYSAAIVKSTSGHKAVRYHIRIPIRIGGKTIRALFNLSDRSGHKYPILIGRRTIEGEFLVDVRHGDFAAPKADPPPKLNQELIKNPRKFYEKYRDQ